MKWCFLKFVRNKIVFQALFSKNYSKNFIQVEIILLSKYQDISHSFHFPFILSLI